LEAKGCDYFDEVEPVEFPQHTLRFRNDQLLIGIQDPAVTDTDFIEAFGKFLWRRPLLARQLPRLSVWSI